MAEANSSNIGPSRRTMSRIDQIDALTRITAQAHGVATALQRAHEESGGHVHNCAWLLATMMQEAREIASADIAEPQS